MEKKRVVPVITISLRRGTSTVGVHRCSFTAHQTSLGKERGEAGVWSADWQTAKTPTVASRENPTCIFGRREEKKQLDGTGNVRLEKVRNDDVNMSFICERE